MVSLEFVIFLVFFGIFWTFFAFFGNVSEFRRPSATRYWNHSALGSVIPIMKHYIHYFAFLKIVPNLCG